MSEPHPYSSAPAGEPFKVSARGLTITFLTVLVSLLQALDNTIANIVLPHIQGSVSASQDQATWVLTSYVVATAIVMPMTGFLASRFGRRAMYVSAVIGFTIASMCCGAAQSIEQIVIFRMAQGACGGVIVPLSMAILLEIYPKDKIGVAMSAWGVGVAVGPVFGTAIGGYLTEMLNWRWCFYVNVPFGIAAALGILWLLPEGKKDNTLQFDLLGFGLLATAIASLQLMIDRGTTLDWFASREIVIEACIAALAFYAFVVHMFTSPRPFLTAALFKDANYILGLVLVFVTGAVSFAAIMSAPLMMQNLLGYPVLTTGTLTMSRGAGTLIVMAVSSYAVRMFSTRFLVMFSTGILALGCWHLSTFNLQVSSAEFVVNGFILGCGWGLMFVPITTLTLSTLTSKYHAESAGVISLVRNLGISIGISSFTTLFVHNAQLNHAQLVEYVTPFSHGLYAFAGQTAGALSGIGVAQALDSEINRQAQMIAYIDGYRLIMYLAIGMMVLALAARPAKTKELPPDVVIVEA
jgi:DHA2 family multidrug resistance protein